MKTELQVRIKLAELQVRLDECMVEASKYELRINHLKAQIAVLEWVLWGIIEEIDYAARTR